MRKLDWKNDGLLQSFFGAFQASDVIPFDIGLLNNNGFVQGFLKFLRWVVGITVSTGVFFFDRSTGVVFVLEEFLDL